MNKSLNLCDYESADPQLPKLKTHKACWEMGHNTDSIKQYILHFHEYLRRVYGFKKSHTRSFNANKYICTKE